MKQKYEHIQLLRALACIGVFITHLAPRLGATGKAAWLANQGAAGVYLFFVLSGYLACCDRKLPTAGKKELLTYYKKRLVRILPLYYGVILYNILLHGLILKDIPADPQGLYWLRYFFLTNSVIPAPNDFWGNLSATWTISLFMAFYLLVPVFVRLIRGCTSAFFCYVLALILRYLWVKTGYGDYMMIFLLPALFSARYAGLGDPSGGKAYRRAVACLYRHACGSRCSFGPWQGADGFVYLVVVVLWHVTACRQRLSVLQERNRR